MAKTTKAAANAEKVATLTIAPLQLAEANIHIVGDTPLICHRWSEKAKRELLEAQMTEDKKRKKPLRNPEADFVNTLYLLDGDLPEPTEEALNAYLQNGGRIGFPATAFKACAISGTYRSGVDVKMTELKANLHIPEEFVVINGRVEQREDMVKIGGISKVSDIRFRAQICDWSADVHVRYNLEMLSISQVVNLFQRGGFACGVGEWRPEKGGTFGCFRVTGAEATSFE